MRGKKTKRFGVALWRMLNISCYAARSVGTVWHPNNARRAGSGTARDKLRWGLAVPFCTLKSGIWGEGSAVQKIKFKNLYTSCARRCTVVLAASAGRVCFCRILVAVS